MKLLPNKKLAWRIIENKAYVLNPEKSELHCLDEVAASAWKIISRGVEFEKLCGIMSGEYDVDKKVLNKDLLELVGQLRRKSLLA